MQSPPRPTSSEMLAGIDGAAEDVAAELVGAEEPWARDGGFSRLDDLTAGSAHRVRPTGARTASHGHDGEDDRGR